MGIGPFTTYAPPGVYTQTIVDPIIGQLLAGLRVPVIIGVARETLSQSNVEIIRGSSALADTPIFGEDAAGHWVVGGTPSNPTLGNQDGSRTTFRVRNYPIVDGFGVGRVTFDASSVNVTINGQQTIVSSVDGANGLVSLLVPPGETDNVAVNYFFRRSDTKVTDNVSAQVSPGPAVLVAPRSANYVVTSGTNDLLEVFVNDSSTPSQIPLTSGTRSATDVANDVNAAAVTGLTASVVSDAQGLSHVQLVASGNVRIGSGSANGVLGFNPGDYTARTRTFRVFNLPIVDGSGGGITTTDPSKVTVRVNGLQVLASAVDGSNGTVTLATAPNAGSTVTIEYYFNTWQDTFDYLPNNNIMTVGNVGISPDRRDYLSGPDFVVVNDGDQSRIVWGTSWGVQAGLTTGGSAFDSTQVVGLLVDDRMFGAECTRYTDPSTNTASTTRFVLPLKPTTGNGRDTPLGLSLYQTVTNGRIDLPTNRPDLVVAYVGKSFRDAYSRPPVTVTEVDSATNQIVLKNPVSADYKVFATFWYNRIADDTYTLSVTVPGASGVGKYTVTSELNNNAPVYSAKFGTKTALPQTVQWPSGVESVPDAIHYGGTPVSETATVTFLTSLLPATHASFSNASPEPYNIFAASQIFGNMVIDGGAPFSVNLSTGFVAQLLSQPVSSPGSMTFLSTDRLVLQVDGVNIDPIDVSAAVSLANVATAINSAIDADSQTHADGSGTFASTAPNNLASVVTYGSESVLRVRGRNLKTSTNGLVSNVKVLSPTASGQTDAAAKVGFGPNQEALGSFNALNQAAQLIGSEAGPFNITAAVNDLLLFNIDGQDYSATLPSGAAVPSTQVVDYINAWYAQTAPSAAQATILAAAVILANELKSDYNTHRTQATIHSVNDTANVVTAANATDLATLLTLCADIRTQLNAHYSNSGGSYHLVADTVNPITVAAPTDLRTAVIFLNEAKTSYNAHRTQTGVHPVNDAVNVTTALNAQVAARVGAGIDLDKVILVSQTNTVDSQAGVSSAGTANTVLGLTGSAAQARPDAARIAGALNGNSTFAGAAVAYRVQASGLGGFLRIDSRTAGTGSTIAFATVANTAFITDTGLGIVPGTSGDSGEAAQSGFQVTSSNPAGSSGTGIPGQTYTDARTGLRFTVLPASSGDYANNGSFTIVVDTNFTADASIPSRAIPGLEFNVLNTLNMGVNTTALLTTYRREGNEPSVGDVYYISYNFAKSDLSTKLFRDPKRIQQNFGPPTPEFPLSLAAQLALTNGAVLVALKQVLKSSGTSQASVSAFTQAIDELRKPIEGNIKPDIITPLGTDPEIFAYLNQHCAFMSSPRQEGERTGVVGVAGGTTPLGVGAIAQGLQSELMVVAYPDTYVLTAQTANGDSVDQLVDSTYMASSIAATTCAPSIDVAQPWTRRSVLGFKKLGRVLDPTEANTVAVSGVTVVEQTDLGMRLRHGLTTNVQTVVTRTPSVTLTIQFVQQSVRAALDPYIGQKFTGSLIKSVESNLSGMFSNLIDGQIVLIVAGIAVTTDEDDPTVLRTDTAYVPVFPLEYILSTLQVRIRA